MSLLCKIIGCKFIHVQKYYGVVTGRTEVHYFNHCLRCGKKLED